MSAPFDPTLPYTKSETWEMVVKGQPGWALDRCEQVLSRKGMAPSKRKSWEKLQMRIVCYILDNIPPVPKPNEGGENDPQV